jgi:hypothetical protein
VDLIEHLESELGIIKTGWNKFPEEEETWPFQVAEMNNGFYQNISAFSTIGLSWYPLVSDVSGKIIYQELIILLPENYGQRNVPAVLHDIGQYALDNSRAYLRGEVFDYYQGVIFTETNFTAFYIARPVYFSDNFFECHDSKTGNKIILCWLIPIYQSEKIFIKENGWNKFEEKIEETNPDFFDLQRKPIF